MIIHFLLFFVTVVFAKLVEKTGTSAKTIDGGEKVEENRAAFWAALLSYFPTIFVIGVRTNLGDSLSYVENFNSLDVSGDIFSGLAQRNPGYELLMRVFKRYISDRPELWMLFLTFLSFAFLLAAYSRYSPSFFLSTFIFFGSTEISYSFNGARQFLAICIMLYALKFIEQKKIIKYIIVCLAAYFVHQTALVIIPAYFVVRGKVFNKKMIAVLIATLAATMFSSMFMEYLNKLFIEESVYAHYYDGLVSSAGINIFRVLVAAVPMALCFVYKKRIDALDDERLNICANMSILGFGVSLFASTSGGDLLGRLAEYYLIYNTLTYPILLKKVISKNIYPIICAGLMIGYFAFYFYQFVITWGGLGYESELLGIAIE